jgi:aldehyde dehydrogenase (NAD+)
MSLAELSNVSISSPDRFFIGGEWTKPASSAEIDVINASTEEVLFTVAEAKEADMDRAIAAAREAFDHGPRPQMSHAERAVYLSKLAAALDERGVEISQIWSGQMGILNSIAQAASGGHGNPFRYYAGLADSFPFMERHTPTGGKGECCHVSVGH